MPGRASQPLRDGFSGFLGAPESTEVRCGGEIQMRLVSIHLCEVEARPSVLDQVRVDSNGRLRREHLSDPTSFAFARMPSNGSCCLGRAIQRRRQVEIRRLECRLDIQVAVAS